MRILFNPGQIFTHVGVHPGNPLGSAVPHAERHDSGQHPNALLQVIEHQRRAAIATAGVLSANSASTQLTGSDVQLLRSEDLLAGCGVHVREDQLQLDRTQRVVAQLFANCWM